MQQLKQISVLLIGTTHPGNIGAAARALKVMGLDRLSLVNPEEYPSAEARARASGADDVLSSANVYETLDSALSGVHKVFGTSARSRGMDIPILDMRTAAAAMIAAADSGEQVAMLFGKERYGLTNEEMQRCHYLVQFPANPDYGSLNLAAAVQVAAYELRMQCLQQTQSQTSKPQATSSFCDGGKMTGFYQHLFSTMHDLDFLNVENQGSMTEKFRMMFNRMGIKKHEMDMLRGFLSAVNKNLKK